MVARIYGCFFEIYVGRFFPLGFYCDVDCETIVYWKRECACNARIYGLIKKYRASGDGKIYECIEFIRETEIKNLEVLDNAADMLYTGV